jgi:hypothetical protein
MTVIEIKPHLWGWKVFEAPGVEPVFPEKPHAINYAQSRASFRSGKIRILDSTGKLERTLAFRIQELHAQPRALVRTNNLCDSGRPNKTR